MHETSVPEGLAERFVKLSVPESGKHSNSLYPYSQHHLDMARTYRKVYTPSQCHSWRPGHARPGGLLSKRTCGEYCEDLDNRGRGETNHIRAEHFMPHIIVPCNQYRGREAGGSGGSGEGHDGSATLPARRAPSTI